MAAVKKSLRKRRRLRRKAIESLARGLQASTGSALFSGEDHVDLAEGGDFDVLLVGGEVVALVTEGEPFPTIRGLLRSPAVRRHVTVDMGAVPHLYNGADVMTPGIVDADPSIVEGDMVWVRDERNRKPLAIGRALVSGEEMVASSKGKAVKTLHYVGDWLWRLGEV